MIEVSHSDGTGQRFEYRADGRLMSAENGETVVQFERDVLGRVLREIQGEHWITSAYDGLGRRVRVRSSLGLDQEIERNRAGAVTGLAANGFEARFTRDSLGQELTRELPGEVRARWSRDQRGLPLRHEVTSPGGPARERTYDWDTGGRLRGVVDLLTGPIRYQHDALARLVSATARDELPDLRMPDAVGNLFHTADRRDRVFGPAGRLLESTPADGRTIHYDYDPEGNLITKRSADGEIWRYPLIEIDPYGLIKAPPSLPDVPGVYIIRNGTESYVGSAGGGGEGMFSRVSDLRHESAQRLLGMEGTTVQYSRVHLGRDIPDLVDGRGNPLTPRAQREHVLRHFEQIQIDREIREGQSLTNVRRAQDSANRSATLDQIRQRGARGGVRRRLCR